MSDLISRQQAIDALVAETIYTEEELKEYYEANSHRDEWVNGIYEAIERIKQLSPIQPKRGKWIPDNNNYIYEQYVCSECKNSFKVDTCMGKPMWNFCPYCGADMRTAAQIVHDAIDNTPMAEDAFPGIKERLHKAVDDMREVTK